MENCVKILKEGKKIAILPHIKPDGDTLGSAFALCRALRLLGKESYVVTDYDIEGKLALLSSGNDYHTKETKGYDTAVAVDVADSALLGSLADVFYDIDLCIDHHVSNRGYAKHTLLDCDAAATGEIIYEIIKALSLEVDGYMARCLYVAISTDTGCFKYSNTTAKTFYIVYKIADLIPDRAKLNRVFFSCKTRRRIALESYVAEHMSFFEGDKIAAVILLLDVLSGVSEDDFDGISQMAVNIEGVETGIIAKETEKGVFRISMRSNECVDVSRVCREFGGGGHVHAAGCTVTGNIEEALINMIGLIKEQLD